jgi:hypothetical protein
MVQKLSNGFRMTECIDCHAPQPIHLTGVDQRVAPRLHARSDGVDCLSCHLLEDGVSVASGTAADTSGVEGACIPQRVPAMGDSRSCVGCHNQHETVNEVADSGTGKHCLDCHMEPTVRAHKQGGSGRSHVFPGAHSLEMHRRATAFELTIRDGNFVARTTNEGGAHRIPTDARHRSYNVFITLFDEQGNLLQKETQMNDGEYRLYYRNQFKDSTQIAHGESREATWPVPEGVSGKAMVRLVYALNPELLVNMDVIEVERTEIPFR